MSKPNPFYEKQPPKEVVEIITKYSKDPDFRGSWMSVDGAMVLETDNEAVENFIHWGLGQCGCGYAEEMLPFYRNILAVMQQQYDNEDYKNHKIAYEIVSDALIEHYGVTTKDKESMRIIAEMVLNSLDAQGLLEHGTNIGGSWLDRKGMDLLVLLNYRWKHEDQFNEGYWIEEKIPPPIFGIRLGGVITESHPSWEPKKR